MTYIRFPHDDKKLKNAMLMDDPSTLKDRLSDDKIDIQKLLDTCMVYDSIRCLRWLDETQTLESKHFEEVVDNFYDAVYWHDKVKWDLEEESDSERVYTGDALAYIIGDPRSSGVENKTYGRLLYRCVYMTCPEAVRVIVDTLGPERCEFDIRYNTLLDWYTMGYNRSSTYPCAQDQVAVNLYLFEVAVLREKYPLDYQSYRLFLKAFDFDYRGRVHGKHSEGLRDIIMRCEYNPIPESFFDPMLITHKNAEEQTVEQLNLLQDKLLREVWRFAGEDETVTDTDPEGNPERKARDPEFVKMLELVHERLTAMNQTIKTQLFS